eukprot:GHVL01023989.1.p2 GENE.GHVL01023989.1~~GHVL01023989.1.p2  ORF type:complete len:282 (+),score=38.86 GHVL01023989.1:42-848(+)
MKSTLPVCSSPGRSSHSAAEQLKQHKQKGRPTHEEIRVVDGDFDPMEHPLETAWTIWYDVRADIKLDADNYADTLKEVGTFNTVEGFFRMFSNINKASDLPRNVNLHVFRHGNIPMWEEFPHGGSWILRVRKKSADVVNRMWEDLVIACISEAFEMHEVVGIILSVRSKEDIFSIWNDSNQKQPQVRFKIGERLKEILGLDIKSMIQYKEFMTALKDYSSFANAKNYMFAVTNSPTQLAADVEKASVVTLNCGYFSNMMVNGGLITVA